MNLFNKIKQNNHFLKKTIKNTFNLIQSYLKCKTQIIIKSNIGTSVKIKNKKIENIEFKDNSFMEITIFKNKRKNVVLCNNFDKKTIIKCINYVINTIKYTSKDKNLCLPTYELYKQKTNKQLGIIFNDYISTNEMSEIAINVENNSLNTNKKIKSDYTFFSKNINNIIIYNNYDIIKNYYSKTYFLINNIIAQKKNNMEFNYNYIYTHKLSDLLHKSHYLGKKTAEQALLRLNIKKINTKNQTVIFDNKTSSEIFYYLFKSIQGKNIINKTSFMLNKINKKILPNWLNIIENPHLFKGIGTKPFDKEGSNTYKYTIIKNGILNNLILDTYSAKTLNKINTSNYGGIHNWCFTNKKQNITKQELIKKMNNGIIIDRLLGDGVNLSNGLYSKGISGFYIKNGKILFSINEVTISGNLKDLFKNIINMSNDYNKYCKIKSGSILVKNIQITGNN